MKQISAYQSGRTDAIRNVANYANVEDYIFVAMATNPYKGKQQRIAYIEGVSSWVNWTGRMANRAMNERQENG